MKTIAFDTETHLIGYPDMVNPRGVCLTAFDGERQIYKFDTEAKNVFRGWLEDPNVRLVGHNVAFDLHVCLGMWPEFWDLVWTALKERRISDTMLRERLYLLSLEGNVAKHPCSLAALCKRWLDVKVTGKEDGWRFRYAELEHVPLEDWPEAATKYAIDDAELTFRVWGAQESARTAIGPGSMNTEHIQVAAAFGLRGMTISGIRVDQDVVKKFKEELTEEHETAKQALFEAGIIRENGSRDQKALEALLESLGATEKTKTGRIATSRKVVAKIISDDLTLAAYRHYADTLKAVTTFIPQMEFDRIHPDYNPIVNTLRTSCRSSNYYKYHGQEYGKKVIRRGNPAPSMNLQQIPRGGNFRHAFIPEEGHLFLCADYANLELVCAAQTYYSLFGESALRDVLNTGQNLHDVTGTLIYNDHTEQDISVKDFRILIKAGDETAKFARQSAKFVNLGCPGGQSAKTIWRLANDLGIKITEEQAVKWREAARGRFPEFLKFFGIPRLNAGWFGTCQNGHIYIKDEDGGMKRVKRYNIDVCGVWRAKCTYTAAANGVTMQMRAALGKKLALIDCYERCTNPARGSALYGSTMHIDLHDEFLISSPVDKIYECEVELSEAMLVGMQKVLPDMRIATESCIMRRWGKDPEEEFGAKDFVKEPIQHVQTV